MPNLFCAVCRKGSGLTLHSQMFGFRSLSALGDLVVESQRRTISLSFLAKLPRSINAFYLIVWIETVSAIRFQACPKPSLPSCPQTFDSTCRNLPAFLAHKWLLFGHLSDKPASSTGRDQGFLAAQFAAAGSGKLHASFMMDLTGGTGEWLIRLSPRSLSGSNARYCTERLV